MGSFYKRLHKNCFGGAGFISWFYSMGNIQRGQDYSSSKNRWEIRKNAEKVVSLVLIVDSWLLPIMEKLNWDRAGLWRFVLYTIAFCTLLSCTDANACFMAISFHTNRKYNITRSSFICRSFVIICIIDYGWQVSLSSMYTTFICQWNIG